MGQPSRVLLVDDKEAVRESLQLALDGFDCVFREAGNAAAALNLIRVEDFDVIFLDLKLPDAEGIDVFREARRLRPTLGRVIVVTALPDEKTEAKAKELGAFKYLHKPLEYEQVRAVFAEASAGMARAPAPTPLPERLLAVQSAVPPAQRPRIGTFPRVLVLDDHRDWLDQIHDVLEGDFDLTLTTDDVDACRWANNEPFAIVVIDMNLARGVSGLDVLSRMRMASPELRAIILSDFPDYMSPAHPRSAIAYVSKRDLAALSTTIKSVLEVPVGPVRVFLSYTGADRDRVSKVYEELVSRGYLPWMDFKSITPGKKWEVEIRDAIDGSDRFVFCLSSTSSSREGPMRKEVKQALEKQSGLRDDSIFIITARLEDCPVVKPLDAFQYADLFRPDGMSRLLAALSSGK
jgi:DNA-binding response OmpR family regulator